MTTKIIAREDGDLELKHDGGDEGVCRSMYAAVDEEKRKLLGCTIDGRVVIGDLPEGYQMRPDRQHHVFVEEDHEDGYSRRALPVLT